MSSSHANLLLMRLSLLLLVCWSCLFSVSDGRSAAPRDQGTEIKSSSPVAPPIRAVNLGGWLVTEGWILPSLFDGIPNKDLLDGTKLHFKSVTQNRYLAAEQGGGAAIVANRTKASDWETFRLWRINETTFNLRVFNNQFVGVDGKGSAVATATTPGPGQTFQIVRRNGDNSRARIRAPNGRFLQAKTMDLVTADYGESTNWGDDDPSVFVITTDYERGLRGEYQICNGYGTEKATQVLTKHWTTYIVESDFSFISSSGLNAVRIPVGWWIASGPKPPAPFVGGSLLALDNAFRWAEKYNLGVIVDLHAAPGSQNGWEHSATRDGSQEWGTTDSSISQTVEVIDFLASRYASSPSLLAVELLNEPLAPGVSLTILKRYYKEAYNAVRKYTAKAYVIMSNRLFTKSGSPTELLQFAGGFSGAVLDVHYYNLFSGTFVTVEQNIKFVRINRSSDLNTLTRQNGPLIFVGEWVAEWSVGNASKNDYQRFAKVQLDVYGRATFGWAYWTLKNVPEYKHWSMEWMIKNGYISLKSQG